MRYVTNSLTASDVSREQKHGREYLAFPAILAREMVLNYPEWDRKELLPAERIAESAPAWADAPVTVNHPPERDGAQDARVPESYTSEVIGRVFRPNALENGEKLRGEIWVDVEKARSLGGQYKQVVNRLEAGETVQVSTGYATIDDDPSGGTHDGEQYDLEQGRLIPNHLALVTNDRRARCDPSDGCAAPRANALTEGMQPNLTRSNALQQARDPNYTDTSTSSDWARPELDAYITAFYNRSSQSEPDETPSSVDELPQEAKRWIAQKSLLGDPDAESYDELLIFPVVEPSGTLVEGALDSVLSTVGNADLSDSQQQSVRRKARDLLEEEFDRDVDRENSAPIDDSTATSVGRAVLNAVTGALPGGEQAAASEHGHDHDHADDCGCGGSCAECGDRANSGADGQTDDADDADTDSDMNDRINRLAEETSFSSEELETFDDSQLDTLEAGIKANADDGGDGDGDGDDPDTSDDDSDDDADTSDDGGDGNDVEEKVNALVERVNQLEQEKEELEAKATGEYQRRQELIDRMVANAQPLGDDDREELESMNMNTLENTARSLGVPVDADSGPTGEAPMAGVSTGSPERANAEEGSAPAPGRSNWKQQAGGDD